MESGIKNQAITETWMSRRDNQAPAAA